MIGWTDGTSLYHYGILGQRRGYRRFQNPDGTYTEEGLRRKRATYSVTSGNPDNTASGTSWAKNMRAEQIKNAGQARSILNAGKQITDSAKNIGNNLRKKSGPSENIRQMSDEELRKEVNRMLLENQYASLKSQRTESGRDTVNRILSIAGDVMAVGASAASIALAIYTIKNKA